jgi:P4 family phage/plasmid primase-like protien
VGRKQGGETDNLVAVADGGIGKTGWTQEGIEQAFEGVRARARPRADEIQRTLAVLAGGHECEVRIRKAWDEGTGPVQTRRVRPGEHEEAALWVAMEGRWSSVTGVYVTLNPLQSDPERRGKAKDEDVRRREWFFIDVDPVRPRECNATDAEKGAAERVAGEVRSFLREQGFPDPVYCDSGNGYHLLYRIDLPNDADAEALVRRSLQALAARFDTAGVKIDPKVCNASRLTKLYGTTVRKGEITEDRPVRESRMLEVPDPLEVVPRGLLERLAAEVPVEAPRNKVVAVRAPQPAPATLPAPTGDRAALVRRAWHYVKQCPPAISGQGGHDQTFKAAVILTRGFGLTFEEAAAVMLDYNKRCVPPWTLGELAHKLLDAREKSIAPFGYLLREGDPADPSRLATTFLAGGVYRFWRGSVWRYEGDRYVEVAEADLKAHLTAHIEAELDRGRRQGDHRGQQEGKGRGRRRRKGKKGPGGQPRRRLTFGTSLLNATLQSLKGKAFLDQARVAMPSMIGQGARDLLALKNGLLDLDTGELLPHTPDWFSSTCLPYEYDPELACPTFLAAVERVTGGDEEKARLLQEWFGYNLIPCTDAQKFLILHGEGANGKSALCAALEALLGPENVSHVSLGELGESFGLAPTLGKLANISADMSQLDRLAEGKLKQLTSGDGVTVNRKFLPAVTAKPTARLTLATNNLPRFSDRSQGLERRAILLPCDAVIPEGERVPGMDKPSFWAESGELPGLLNWALEGLDRLRKNHFRFTDPAACTRAKQDHLDDCNPARAFLRDCCEAAPGEATFSADLYQAFERWCEQEGKTPLPASEFGKQVRRAYPVADAIKMKRAGKAERAWVGVRLLPPAS